MLVWAKAMEVTIGKWAIFSEVVEEEAKVIEVEKVKEGRVEEVKPVGEKIDVSKLRCAINVNTH